MFCHNKPLFRARSGVWALSAFGLLEPIKTTPFIVLTSGTIIDAFED